jgi:hypothetical protein
LFHNDVAAVSLDREHFQTRQAEGDTGVSRREGSKLLADIGFGPSCIRPGLVGAIETVSDAIDV